jgi:hypothetical protein
MLCGEMIAGCSEIHTDHIHVYTLCGQNVVFCILNLMVNSYPANVENSVSS